MRQMPTDFGQNSKGTYTAVNLLNVIKFGDKGDRDNTTQIWKLVDLLNILIINVNGVR